MFDVLDFIDSEEIRAYNRGKQFTPIEQAVLIYISEKATMEQKLTAWKELAETYTEEKFQQGEVGRLTGSDICFREILLDTIRRFTENCLGELAYEGKENLESFFVHVPLPFQKGDILRSVRPVDGKTLYGVLCHDSEDRFLQASRKYGDLVDMSVTLDIFDEVKGTFSHDHYFSLILERCPHEELPEEQRILLVLREVYRGKLDFGSFLELYSHCGGEISLRRH